MKSFSEYLTEAKKDAFPGAEHALHYAAQDGRKSGHHLIQRQLEWNLMPGNTRYIGRYKTQHHYHAKSPRGGERVFYHDDDLIAKAGAKKYAKSGQFHELNMERFAWDSSDPASMMSGSFAYYGEHDGKHVYHSKNRVHEHKTWMHKSKEIAQKAASSHSTSTEDSHGNHLRMEEFMAEKAMNHLKPGSWTFHKHGYASISPDGEFKYFAGENSEGSARKHAEPDFGTKKAKALKEDKEINLKKGEYRKVFNSHLARHPDSGRLRFFVSKKEAMDYLDTKEKKK